MVTESERENEAISINQAKRFSGGRNMNNGIKVIQKLIRNGRSPYRWG